MRKKRILPLLLCVCLLTGLMFCDAAPAHAVDDGSDTPPMMLAKTAVYNADTDRTTITLEAYATGEAVISIIEEEVPTDIILVLDQSGSMAEDMGTVSFSAITGNNRRNGRLFERRHNGGSGDLWHRLGDGSYVSVSVTRNASYTALASNTTNRYYYQNRANLYQLAGGEYIPVTVTSSWSFGGTIYSYTSAAGLDVSSTGSNTVPDFGDAGPLYLASYANAEYVYSYTDENNQTVEIGRSTGENTNFTAVTLYSRTVSSSGGGSKLDALRGALNTFLSAINAKAAGADGTFGTADDINHRVAVVGFASASGYGSNTELLSIAGSNSGSVGIAYGSISAQNYQDVLQDMDSDAGRAMVNAAVGALAAQGATRADLGMEMAQNILAANPVPAGESRNRVVVMFTDGSPTGSNGYEQNVAASAISYANSIKGGYGATVYAVGVFANADPSSAGSNPGGNLGGTSAQLPAACNWFMQNLSSNNGAPQSPSYYLAASDASSLSSIFQQIASQLQTGGSATTLDEQTVIRDIIAPSFALPEGTTAADIRLKSYACTGVDGTGAYTWAENPDALGAVAVISSTDPTQPTTSTNQLSITGFDFAENYVGTVTAGDQVSYRGNKLVISFDVDRREGFIGGNQVQTNDSAGIYENEDAPEPLYVFEQPVLDIPLLDISVSVNDDDVYLGSYFQQNVPADAVKLAAAVEIGGVLLEMNAPNFGLEPWQNAYVNITVTAEGAEGSSLENVTEDFSYTVTVTVAPKYPGTVDDEGASDSGVGSIHVFKPVLRFADSEVWYGDTAVYGDGNLANKTWVHPSDNKFHDDEDVVMVNAEPALTLSYAPLYDGDIADGRVAVKRDIPVEVGVAMRTGSGQPSAIIGDNTIFDHQPCEGECGWVDSGTGSPAFLLHVKTCTLTLTKSGGAEGTPYVFTISRNGAAYTEASITGSGSITIHELPVGSYTVAENADWSWRFDGSCSGPAVLASASPEGALECVNTPNGNIYWLSGYSEAVPNVADFYSR